MSFDGCVMRAVTHECQQLLIGSRIDKISQPNRHEVLLLLRNQNQNYKLLFSTLPQEGRVQLTTTAPPNPITPPLFCMVLRKHLEGGKVLSFEQVGLDRILKMTVQITNEMGDKVQRQLIAEIMGKHSNLILINPESQNIIDSILRIPTSLSRIRQVLPGFSYALPPAKNKLPLWEEQAEQIGARLLQQGLQKPLDKLLLAVYDGLGPLTVQEIIHRAGFNPSQTIECFGQYEYQRLFQVIQQFGTDLLAHQYQPEVILLDNKPKTFSPFHLTQYEQNQRKGFTNVNEMLDFFYQNRGVVNLFRQKQADLEQILRKEQDRCEKKAGLQAAAIRAAQEAQIWRLYGDLLMAHQHSIPQGSEVVLANFYEADAHDLTVPMDPTLTPLQNAQSYFKKYQKAQHTAAQAQTHYEDTLNELTYLESIVASLQTVTEISELSEIRGELQEAGYLKASELQQKKLKKGKQQGKKGVKGGKQKNQPTKILATGQASIDGFQILFGKNNHQNDQVTMKQARNGDLWLHTQKIPSAHVIIRNPERRTIPDKVIEQAAKLCVWNSKARLSSQVPVDYTLRQNVWKPKGAKPGMVLYENYQTMFVTVTESEIAELTNVNGNTTTDAIR